MSFLEFGNTSNPKIPSPCPKHLYCWWFCNHQVILKCQGPWRKSFKLLEHALCPPHTNRGLYLVLCLYVDLARNTHWVHTRAFKSLPAGGCSLRIDDLGPDRKHSPQVERGGHRTWYIPGSAIRLGAPEDRMAIEAHVDVNLLHLATSSAVFHDEFLSLSVRFGSSFNVFSRCPCGKC